MNNPGSKLKLNKNTKARWGVFLLGGAVIVLGVGMFIYSRSSTTTIPPQPNLDYRFGMSVAETMFGLNDADLNTQLNDIASMGIGWIRFDIEWSDVQPTSPNDFNWSAVDRLVAAANVHKIKLLPVLDYTPLWAAAPSCPVQTNRCAPSDPFLFATFAKAAAMRYSSQGITAWEIWNEPNLTASWQPAANAGSYAALLEGASLAIKGVEPNATIISGGLAPTANGNGNIAPITFLSSLYADGAKNYFGAVGMHPYSFPAMPSYVAPWNAWSQMASTTLSLRSVMIKNGDTNKKIWMTEYGAPTGGPGGVETSATDTMFMGSFDHVTESVQAQMLSAGITIAETSTWAGPLFFYSYKDLGTSPTTNENFFGVIRNDGSQKPAYNVIKSLLVTGS